MNPHDPIESFDYFVGKVCTIHTRQINWNLKPEQNLDYFVGIVNSVNECGICLTNVINHKKTFIMTPAIVAIAEESVVADKQEYEQSSKEYEEMKRELFKHNPNIYPPEKVAQNAPERKPVTKVNDSPFVDIASITAHARAAKEKFKK
jgi:hypothetical protein